MKVNDEYILDDKTKVIIREVETSDAFSLVDYIAKVGGESDNLTFGSGGFGLTINKEVEIIENYKKGNGLWIVAFINDELVGNSNLDVSSRERLKHTSSLGITVLKKYWGNGIGNLMMKTMVNYAKTTRLEIITLSVRTDNFAAINLYKKWGFEIIGTYKKNLKIDERYFDTYIMHRYL
ncbi:MAG: GNAT family N-acetyltransferase [Bacilli bacterium]|nr:GNAT family N-acetyltransferase [Bacilli bacterium]